MNALVVHYNHWIGYHVASRLMEEGYEVDGVLDERENTGLELFLGRNSYFHEVTEVRKAYDLAIMINDSPRDDLHDYAARTMQIRTSVHSGTSKALPYTTVIVAPCLIGEGMKTSDKGLFLADRFVPFSSSTWHQHVVYIKDFLNALMEWIKMKKLPKQIEVGSVKEKFTNTKVEKKQFLLENRDISVVIKAIQTFNKRL